MAYTAFPNSFRRDILGRQRLIGCWCSLTNPITTEILGLAGFDWLLLDAEHAPNDVLTLIPQLMALKDSPSAPVVRPPFNDAVIIERLLDAGFYNFLIPFVESAEQARRAVAATRYPPTGIRGVSVAQRSNRYGAVPDYFTTVNEQICVLVQIESRAGLENLDGICAVEGVDGIFIGPSDLAAALGPSGQRWPQRGAGSDAGHLCLCSTARADGRHPCPRGSGRSPLPGTGCPFCGGRE